MKRRIGASQAGNFVFLHFFEGQVLEAVRQDSWSSDSGDDDFIDVTDGEYNHDEDDKPTREWSPGVLHPFVNLQIYNLGWLHRSTYISKTCYEQYKTNR